MILAYTVQKRALGWWNVLWTNGVCNSIGNLPINLLIIYHVRIFSLSRVSSSPQKEGGKDRKINTTSLKAKEDRVSYLPSPPKTTPLKIWKRKIKIKKRRRIHSDIHEKSYQVESYWGGKNAVDAGLKVKSFYLTRQMDEMAWIRVRVRGWDVRSEGGERR
jgi:hypothetical protein